MMSFQDLNQINQAISDIYNVFCQLPIEAEELLTQKFHDFMAGRNNTSIYTYMTFKKFYEAALQQDMEVEDSYILEIGAGKPLGTGLLWKYAGAKNYTSIDKFIDVNLTNLWLERFNTLLEMNLVRKKEFNIRSLFHVDNGKLLTIPENINLIKDSFEEYPFKPNSFDLIYSGAVLEHLTNLENKLEKMHSILAEDGIMIHDIDLREHHTHLRYVPDKNTSVDFLKYSTDEWNNLYPPGSEHYINRLRAIDFKNIFIKSGFKFIEFTPTQKMSLDNSVYNKIHPEFHNYSVEDLQILGIRVIVKK
jgi:SAM-dependent methyltransferase